MTSRCQGLFQPHPFFEGKALGTRLACVASVSNRVIARKLERKQKKGWRGRGKGEEETLARKPHDSGKRPLIFHGSPPPSPSLIFFLLLSQLSRRTSRGNACYAGYFGSPGGSWLHINVVINWQLSKQYHLTVSRAQVSTHQGRVFLKLSADNLFVFKWLKAHVYFFLKFISNMLCLCQYRPAL